MFVKRAILTDYALFPKYEQHTYFIDFIHTSLILPVKLLNLTFCQVALYYGFKCYFIIPIFNYLLFSNVVVLCALFTFCMENKQKNLDFNTRR